MFADSVFFQFVLELRQFSTVFISLLNFFICLIAIYFIRKYFNYAGLCGYMVLSSMIGNVQVLYATSYGNMEVLLGTVIFCSSFLACDIINIEYGIDKAKKAVYFTIIMDIFFLLNVILTLGHRPIDYNEFPDFGISKETTQANAFAINQIFLPIPRLLIGSYCAYLFSQLGEIWLLNFARKSSKFQFLKHNICLFISSVCLDNVIFTLVALYWLSSEPLHFLDFWQICLSAVIVRGICNFGNTTFIKILKIGR